MFNLLIKTNRVHCFVLTLFYSNNLSLLFLKYNRSLPKWVQNGLIVSARANCDQTSDNNQTFV